MKTHLFALAAFGSLLVSSNVYSQQDAPPVDANAILNSLEKLGTNNETASKQLFNTALNEINQAAFAGARATEFYEKATRATQFAGLQQQTTAFQDWKKKQGDKLRTPEFQHALQFHLQYLSLSLRFANGASAKDLLPELIAYTDKVYTAKPEVLSQEMMRRAVSDSLFVRWLGLTHCFAGLKGWEVVPVGADGIWEKTILPEMRAAKNPAIIRYWDERLRREASQASERRLDFDADKFDNITRPALLWKRAEDLALLGSRNTAINEMLALIKNFPTHPSNAAWISQLKGMLAQKAEK